MRFQRYISLLLLACCIAGGLGTIEAQTVSAPGAYDLPNPSGIDHVFIFKDLTDAVIKTQSAIDKLYRMNGADSVLLADSGMDEWMNMDDNTGYIVYVGTSRTTFWVLDYSRYMVEMHELIADEDSPTSCDNTHLTLQGNLSEMSYRTQFGSKHVINRECEVSYTTLAWSGEEWQDSVCTETHVLQPTLTVGAPLCDTEFTLRADDISKALGLEQDSIISDLYHACAVAANPTTITTVRGTEAENLHTNEVERPTEDTQLKGSAPLDILFKANATPTVKYYRWQILKGNDLIAQRNDESHRYVFDDFGEYRVLLWVSNDKCQTDSTEITVSVSTSQLLVPNVFTPNGDGRNDEFRVMYRSIVEFDCWVYNRWGKLVYHWSDPAKGWDGTINGRPAAEGAYYYVIRAKGADAEADGTYHKVTKKRPAAVGVYQLSGDINLIRGDRKNK